MLRIQETATPKSFEASDYSFSKKQPFWNLYEFLERTSNYVLF